MLMAISNTLSVRVFLNLSLALAISTLGKSPSKGITFFAHLKPHANQSLHEDLFVSSVISNPRLSPNMFPCKRSNPQ